MMDTRRWLPLAAFTLLLLALPGAGAAARQAPQFKPPDHGFFTALPKHFARLEKFDPARRELTLVLEKDGQTITRQARPDADFIRHGGLGLLAELRPGDRLWVVFDKGASREDLKEVRFLTDEVGLQTIHGHWFTVDGVAAGERTLTVRPPAKTAEAPPQTLKLARDVRVLKGERRGGPDLLAAGDRVRTQSRFEDGEYRVAEILDQAALERDAARQRRRLEEVLAREGVPGEVQAVQTPLREAALLLYRPGSNAARLLRPGDRIRVSAGEKRVSLPVKQIKPWGEKTSVTVELPVGAPELMPGQAIRFFLGRARVEGELPPGLGRATEKNERVEWLLASIYCTCGQGPDTCTGHLYTLAMCEPVRCPMPSMVRGKLEGWIDGGKTDAEILALLLQEQGPLVRQIHLLGNR